MRNASAVVAYPLLRSAVAAGLACAVAVALSGCVGRSPMEIAGGLAYDPTLITGERTFGVVVSTEEVPRVALNEPSDAMRSYVAEIVGNRRLASMRFRRLFETLNRDGYFDAVYSADRTLTAAQAFEARGGNCLSYTNMFVALAREAGLDARYQVVDIPPSWDADSGFLIRYTHVNVVLRNVSLEGHPGDRVIVDFNIVHPDPDNPQREVSDDYAESLFYANRSVALLRLGNSRESFAYLRRALSIAPENLDLWINLGAFYATQHDYGSSVEAYDVALQIDPRNKSAYSGLARSYANAGNAELAATYEEKVRNYRRRNPYYHYALAQAAFAEADYERSLDAINTAIGLKGRTARFHLFKGLVQQRMGDIEAAEDSFRRAQRFGLDYRVKLDVLRSVGGLAAS